MEVLVCDHCGQPAFAKRVIDVCKDHEHGALLAALPKQFSFNEMPEEKPKKYGRGGGGIIYPKKKCDYCEGEYAPQGMYVHTQSMHPDQFPAWREAKQRAKAAANSEP